MTPIFGHDQTVGEWVGQQLNKTICPPFTAIGWIDAAGMLKAGAVFNSWNGSNIEVTIFGPRGFGKDAIKTVFRYAFVQLGANRLTATTERSNVKMHGKKGILRRLGFTYEATHKHFFGPCNRHDGIVFRMLKDEAGRWIK